jgi:hypothetical protein
MFEQKQPETRGPWRTRAYTSLGLVGLAAAVTITDRLGVKAGLPESADMVADSLRHPAAGYVGALAATLAIKGFGFKKTALAGATIANFGAEITQLAASQVPTLASLRTRETEFYLAENLPETTKDLAFAIAGGGLLLMQNRLGKAPENLPAVVPET